MDHDVLSRNDAIGHASISLADHPPHKANPLRLILKGVSTGVLEVIVTWYHVLEVD